MNGRFSNDDQQVREKVLRNTKNKRNANQNQFIGSQRIGHNWVTFPFTFVHCWQKRKLVQLLQKTFCWFLRKLKKKLPCDPAISLRVFTPTKWKQKDTCTLTFIVALFTLAETWNNLCSQVDEWIKKRKIHIHTQHRTEEYYSFMKRRKPCYSWQHGWTLRWLC